MAQLHRHTPRRPTRAFTLVEVMMAATILVVGFMGMIHAITIGSEMLATARRQTLAAQIMTHELEKLRYADWSNGTDGISDLATGGVNGTPITIDTHFNSAKDANGTTYMGAVFVLTRTCTYVSGTSNQIREITFTIKWTVRPSGLAASRTYTRMMSGYYGNNGLNLTYQRS